MKRIAKHLSKAKSKKPALVSLLSLLTILALGNSGGTGGGGKKASCQKSSSLQLPRVSQSDN